MPDLVHELTAPQLMPRAGTEAACSIFAALQPTVLAEAVDFLVCGCLGGDIEILLRPIKGPLPSTFSILAS